MPVLTTPPNKAETTIAAGNSFKRGTDTDIVGDDASTFPNARSAILITYGAHWCLVIYSTKSENTLTMANATDYALAKNVSTGDASYTFPAGSTVKLVCSADMIKQLLDEDGTWTKNRDAAGFDIADLGKLNFDDATKLTIATGAITVVQSYHTVDTEGEVPTDDLDTINGGVAGDKLHLRPENTARTVVLKHGTGNIVIPGGSNYSLDTADKTVVLLYDGINWRLLALESMVTNAKARIYLGAGQEIATGTDTKLNLDTVEYDPGGNTDLVNKRITIPVDGYYLLILTQLYHSSDVVADKIVLTQLRVSGVAKSNMYTQTSVNQHISSIFLDILHLTKDQYLEFWTHHTFGAASTLQQGSTYTFMLAHLISAD